jgi:predicted nucleic acid-binding protein
VIVVDASAMTEFLLGTPLGLKVEARLFRHDDELHVPHLLDVEVAQALRRLVQAREVSSDRAEEALADLSDFDLHRHPHLDYLARMWDLRNNLTSYDAVYVALAEAVASPLVTCDALLGRSPGHTAQVEVIR